MKYSASLAVVWVLPVSAFLVALCVFVCMRGEEVAPVCMLEPVLLLRMDIFSLNVCLRVHCVFDCVSAVGHVRTTSQFLLSRLCVIGSLPAEPFVCVLPCAYINCVALLNNIAK